MSKKIMVVWGMVIFLMCFTILLIGIKQKDLEHIKVNSSVKIAAYKYIYSGHKLKISGSDIVYIEDLINDGYLSSKNNDSIKKYCVHDVSYSRGLFGYSVSINYNCEE